MSKARKSYTVSGYTEIYVKGKDGKIVRKVYQPGDKLSHADVELLKERGLEWRIVEVEEKGG